MQAPILVLNQNTQRETGNKAQLGNIAAAKAVADIIRTTLGPRSMLKMLLDPMGGVVITNDGNAILREVDVSHPAAKSMIELSRTQDEEVGDGTTSVIILSGELLSVTEPLLYRKIHPVVIAHGFSRALQDALTVVRSLSFELDLNNRDDLLQILRSCIGTKFVSRFGDLACNLALDAVLTVAREMGSSRKEIDIKRYAKVEKLPGGDLEESVCLRGVVLNKDVTNAEMRRRIENPRILLLDCPLEYKKGESQTNIEVTREEHWEQILQQEEDFLREMCNNIIAFRPDLVITEKGVSDIAQHFLMKANISCLRRVRKTDNNRISRATGATIVNRTDEIRESDIGTECGLFEVRKHGDEYFSYLVECQSPKACSIVLRGGSMDVLKEIERNLQDAMCVARNVVTDPRLVPGGGAVEMAVSRALSEKANLIQGQAKYPYKAVADALEVIPRTLAQNCGTSVIRIITQLRAKHAGTEETSRNWGINGNTGEIADMLQLRVLEPLAVKEQTLKTAIEAAAMIVRIDEIVSGISKQNQGGGGGGAGGDADQETFGDSRDG